MLVWHTGPTTKQSTSAPWASKLCSCVHVRESQNLTMPRESPEMIVPSLSGMINHSRRRMKDYELTRQRQPPKQVSSPPWPCLFSFYQGFSQRRHPTSSGYCPSTLPRSKSLAIRPRLHYRCRPPHDGPRHAVGSLATMVVPKPVLKCGSLNGQDGEDVEKCHIPRTKAVWNHPRSPVRESSKWGLRQWTKWSRHARAMISKQRER
jgi:hypothetical protein